MHGESEEREYTGLAENWQGRIRGRTVGSKADSDVTKKTSYLVVGADPGSKSAKAQKLGVKTLNEAEFLELLNQNTSSF